MRNKTGSLRGPRRPTKPQRSFDGLPILRLEVPDAARVLRMSRAQLYIRIQEGAIRPQKDGSRTYITMTELQRYVDACASATVS